MAAPAPARRRWACIGGGRPIGLDAPRAMRAGRAGRSLAARLARFAPFASVLALAACVQAPPRPPDVAPREPQALGLEPAVPTPEAPAEWWREFGDPALDALVARALAEQPSLAAAAARVARAAALVEDREAAARPQLAATADATVQRYTENGLYPRPLAGSVQDSETVQLVGSWELGFFGRHQAALRSALGARRAAAADADAARSLLATQVVRGWVGLARGLEQQRLLGRSIALREQLLARLREREAAGLDGAIERHVAEGALAELRQQHDALAETTALTRHQLAALSAQPPAALAGAVPALAPLKVAATPERLGVDLLGRRADVAAARWRADAAADDVALARAQFMPDLNLMAFAGFSALGIDRLVDLGSRNVGAGAALRLPLFDRGRLAAQLDARRADRLAAVAAYDAAVIDAVREAADAVATLRSLDAQQQRAAQALAAAESAWRLAAERRRAGLAPVLPALTAEIAWLDRQRSAADLRARRLDAQAQLMRALGGGWREPDAPTAPPSEGARSSATAKRSAAAAPIAEPR